jgi:hypothetical protein
MRGYRLTVSSWEIPHGYRKIFGYVGELVGGWKLGRMWVIPCAVLRALDPERAATVWRSLPPDHVLGDP